MGSGTSRGKRVAPVIEVSVAKTASRKSINCPFKPPKIHAILRNARNRTQPGRHSEGRDSDFSREDDGIDGDMDTAVAGEQEQSWASAKRKPPKRNAFRSKTYGLCHSSQEDEESGSEEPRGSRDVNKGDSDASPHFKKQTAAPSSQLRSSPLRGFVTRDVLLEAVPTPEKKPTFGNCHSSSLTPVILYDGSEEELMDTIEREFS